MTSSKLRLYLTSLLFALSMGVAALVAGNGHFTLPVDHVAGQQATRSPGDTIDYLKGQQHPGIVQSSLQNQLVRPGRTAFGKNDAPLRMAVQNAFVASARPVNGFVRHLFISQSSFLVESTHCSRAPPFIPA